MTVCKLTLISLLALGCSAKPISVLSQAPLAAVAHAPIALAASVHAPIAVAHGAPFSVAHAPIAEPYDTHPQYHFAYGVQDLSTGDVKEQQETRDGDVVQGTYSLIEPDGTRRRVDYTADPINGFNAVVHKEPLTHAAPVHTPIALSHGPVALTSPLLGHSATFLH